MFPSNPIPRPSGPPASSTPMNDYLSRPVPGGDPENRYVVLPRALRRSIGAALRRGRSALLRVRVRAVDTAGNAARRALVVRIVR